MSVYYKFRSAKDYDTLQIDDHFIRVGYLKEKIFEIKQLGRGTDFDLIVTNAQTNEEYLDEGMLIPKNTSVLIRRVPGWPRRPIITAPVPKQEEPNFQKNSDEIQVVKGSIGRAEASAVKCDEDLECDEFGEDIYAIHETIPVKSGFSVQEAAPVSKEDEESKIKALVDTSALDWQGQSSDSVSRQMSGGSDFGRVGFAKKMPPQGYICHRCMVAGHFIRHCPTNGDPNFDIKRAKPPTGIPKTMLMASPNGSYVLTSRDVVVLKPNEVAFDKEMEGIPSSCYVHDLPPELHCPLCNEVIKDAALTSKCCFTSFCDKCIRDYIISMSKCVCGATNVLADDLLPNKTLRDTINRILLSNNNSSAEHGGSAFQVQGMESHDPQAKVTSPAKSAASKRQQGHQVAAPSQHVEGTSKIEGIIEENKAMNVQEKQEKSRTLKVPAVSEVTHDTRSVKEEVSWISVELADEEVRQKHIHGEAEEKKRKKKTRRPPCDMQWRSVQDLGPENYMMPLGPSPCAPCWNGIQPFMSQYPCPFPYIGYALGLMDAAFGDSLPQYPFGASMLPYCPPKREPSKDREYGREASSAVDGHSIKCKSNLIPERRLSDRQSPEFRFLGAGPQRPSLSSKNKSEFNRPEDRHQRRDHHNDSRNRDHQHRSSHRGRRPDSPPPSSGTETKSKAKVFSRISISGDSKKRMQPSSSDEEHNAVSSADAVPVSVDYDSSSDDERHFKRRRRPSEVKTLILDLDNRECPKDRDRIGKLDSKKKIADI